MDAGNVAWPESVAREYRERGYWVGGSIGDALSRSFLAHADREAVVDGTRRVTYRELGRQVELLAGHMVNREIRDGARVIFQLPNILEFVALYIACLRVGAVPVACHPHHRHAEIAALTKASSASALFICSSFRGFDYVAMAKEVQEECVGLKEVWVAGEQTGGSFTSVGELLRHSSDTSINTLREFNPKSSALAVLQLSGGTTGLPKLIPRTHDDYYYNSMRFAAVSGFGRDGVLLVSIPVAHNFPLACPGIQGALLLGARIVLAPSPSPDVVFPLIEQERATWVPAVPATVIQWTTTATRARFDLSSIRALYVGGQRLNPEPAEAAVRVFGPVVRQVYGMAEGLLCCTRDEDPPDWHLQTQGRPMSPADELRIVDDDGRDIGPNQIGELLCRGPYTIRGYFGSEGYNDTAFTSDGFYKTGDLVRKHSSGNLVIEGRKRDIINRGGEKIGVEEIENLILGHPAVQNAAVVSMPDPVLGERVCACVVMKNAARLTLDELRRFLRDEKRISPTKLPERLEAMGALPATAVGKVSKKDLREFVRRSIEAETAPSNQEPEA
jgi:2,3-dihydroxybenzoate-AMP ligase